METALFLAAVLQFALVISFFVLVARVGAIKRLLETPKGSYIDSYQQGEPAEYLGKKEQALEYYRIAMFRMTKLSALSDSDKRNKMQIEKKIQEFTLSSPLK